MLRYLLPAGKMGVVLGKTLVLWHFARKEIAMIGEREKLNIPHNFLGPLLEEGVFNGVDLRPQALELNDYLLERAGYWLRQAVGQTLRQVDAVVSPKEATALSLAFRSGLTQIQRVPKTKAPIFCQKGSNWQEWWQKMLPGRQVLLVTNEINPENMEELKEDISAIRGSGATVLGVATFYNPHHLTAERLGLEAKRLFSLIMGENIKRYHRPSAE
jgi:hypothetical protein